MLEEELRFERGCVRTGPSAGEAFWEPGGDTIHHQAADNLHNTRVCVVDVFARAALRDVVADARPDLVMRQWTDLANGTSASDAHLRVTGTRNVLHATISAGVATVVA